MANDNDLRTTIRQMLDSGALLPETADELRDYLAELDRTGSLESMDADYVQGLAQRLGFGGKGVAPGPGEAAAPPAGAGESTAGASIARIRGLVGMLYDPETGLVPDVSDERAAEILGEVLRSLDEAESAISRD